MNNNEYLVKMNDYVHLEKLHNQALKDLDEKLENNDKAIKKIENDIIIMTNSLKDDHHYLIKRMLKAWLQYDEELLEILKK